MSDTLRHGASQKPALTASGADWTLHLGDCIEGMRSLADKSVDVVITDPPFDDVTHSRGGGAVRRYDGGPDIATIPFAPLHDVAPVAEQFARICRRWCLIFCAVRQIEQWSTSLESFGLRVPRVVIWVKPDASPQFSGDRPGHGYESIVVAHPVGRTHWNGGGKKGVYTHCRIDRGTTGVHPTQKPIPLLRELVEDFTDAGELVCDPFTGSGTTALACLDLNRRFLGWELNRDYFDIACRRLRGDEAKPRPEQPGLFDSISGR